MAVKVLTLQGGNPEQHCTMLFCDQSEATEITSFMTAHSKAGIIGLSRSDKYKGITPYVATGAAD